MSTTAVAPSPSGVTRVVDEHGYEVDIPDEDVVWADAPHPAGPGSVAAPRVSDVEQLIGLLEGIDGMMARAVGLLRTSRRTGQAERSSGLPVERLVSLRTSRTGADVRFLSRAERTLVNLPSVDQAFAEGRLSWSQVRGIVTAAKGLRVTPMRELDGALAQEIGQGEPDRIVQRAFGWADVILEDDATVERQDPGDRKSFQIYPDLFGGAAYAGYDRIDAVSAIYEAAQAAADAPVKAEQTRLDADGQDVPAELLPSTRRQAQLAEGLRRVADAYLAGVGTPSPAEPTDDHDDPDQPDGPEADVGQPDASAAPRATGRARPCIHVVLDYNDLLGATGRALLAMHGEPIRLSRFTLDRLLCDSQLSTVITDSGRPIAAGDATAPITLRHRRTLFAVDRGCRMPGCAAPPQHCDAHHLIPRSRGGPTSIDNLVLMCRDCHSRIHRYDMTLTLDRQSRAVTLHVPAGTLSGTPDGHTFTSLPA